MHTPKLIAATLLALAFSAAPALAHISVKSTSIENAAGAIAVCPADAAAVCGVSPRAK